MKNTIASYILQMEAVRCHAQSERHRSVLGTLEGSTESGRQRLQMPGGAAAVPRWKQAAQRTGWSLPKVQTLLAIGPIAPSSGARV
jgi:hypothetical protein